MFARSIGWFLGLEQVASVDRVRPAFGAEWASRGSGPFWLCFAIAAIVVLVGLFYAKLQGRGSAKLKGLLAGVRILLLVLLLVTLAEPMLRVTVSRLELPTLFVVLDGTASMEIRDRYSADQIAALERETGLRPSTASDHQTPTRAEYLRAWLGKESPNPLARIVERRRCRLRVFLFEGQTTSRVRELASSDGDDGGIDWADVSNQLTSSGQVTALGAVLRDLARQPGRHQAAGVLLLSDFAQTSGEHPIGGADPSVNSPIRGLGVPVFTVGVGAGNSRDLAVELRTDPKIRRGEKTMVSVDIRQTELEGQTVSLRLTARPLQGDRDRSGTKTVGRQEVELTGERQVVEFSYLPEQAGEIELSVQSTTSPGEIVTENNRASRRIQVIDDFLRLLYVAYEPTWEWRFVKEVFHRDPAVGMRGFRTYLASSDPRVRQSNPLFLPALTQDRASFLENDVILLDDMPKSALTPRFCALTEEFVRDFGGGLVVIAGPRFGLTALADTPLARLLPVLIDPRKQLRDQREFDLKLTARAREFPFMQLDESPERNRVAWNNLASLPWYQPVANKHERAVVLAEHPFDKCLDGKTPQPLIAIRRYGEGEVVFLAFNETWRLRRKFGDKYYRRFWLPLIDRLGLSHALGPRKRFVVRTDRQQYRIEDEAIVTVQAYDQNYEPLDPAELDADTLEAEIISTNDGSAEESVEPLRIGWLRPGVFETRFPVARAGVHRIRVKDPITSAYSERQFRVTDASAELRSSVRDETMQHRLATESQGDTCTLEHASVLIEGIKLDPFLKTEEHNFAIWRTPGWFILVVLLMLGEWALRKWVHLV